MKYLLLSQVTMLYNYMCIAGDLKTDFSRATSWHTRSLNNFIAYEFGSDKFLIKSRSRLL